MKGEEGEGEIRANKYSVCMHVCVCDEGGEWRAKRMLLRACEPLEERKGAQKAEEKIKGRRAARGSTHTRTMCND